MAIMPYPSKPPANSADKNKASPYGPLTLCARADSQAAKPAAPAADKKPGGVPAWSGWMPPMAPMAGMPGPPAAPAGMATRPLPVPGATGGPQFSLLPGMVPGPPPPTPGVSRAIGVMGMS
jgi:hypothetical protein